METLQQARFWINFFDTRQILNQFFNASETLNQFFQHVSILELKFFKINPSNASESNS